MFTQGNNLKLHESQHASLGHRRTQDEAVRERQTMAAKRKGRPSLMETDRRKLTEEIEEDVQPEPQGKEKRTKVESEEEEGENIASSTEESPRPASRSKRTTRLKKA